MTNRLPASSLLLVTLLCVACATGGRQSGDQAPEMSDAASFETGAAPVVNGEAVQAPPPPGAVAAGEDPDDWEALMAEYGDDYADTGPIISDPLRPWNKFWFHFNDKLYFWVLRPVAKGYGWVVPEVARRGLDNAFDNIRFPIRALSSVFQARFRDAGVEVSRFFINTTVGVVGFWDAADDLWAIKRRNEDFDQAFGSWGVGTGWYLTWPLMGPSSVRGTAGMVFDAAANPFTYLFLLPNSGYIGTGVGALDRLNNLSLNPDAYADIIKGTADPYSAVRDGYVQNRQKLVAE